MTSNSHDQYIKRVSVNSPRGATIRLIRALWAYWEDEDIEELEEEVLQACSVLAACMKLDIDEIRGE